MSTSLRARMLAQMTLRNMSPRTKEAYTSAVAGLARYYRRSPDKLTQEQVQRYLLYLHNERRLAWSSCNVAYSALRFFYTAVHKQPEISFSIPSQRKESRLPNLLSTEEVQRILNAVHNPKHRALLMTIYGGGLRVGEAVRIKPHHIESSRMLIRVEQGKGKKDRYTLLPKKLLGELRSYWRYCRPTTWLFPGRDRNRPMPINTAQKIYYQAKKKAGITKGRGIHTLRHCFATHLLEAGCDIFTLKRLLGHTALSSTTRYLHVDKNQFQAMPSPLDTFKEC